jgi:hypothetical protein
MIATEKAIGALFVPKEESLLPFAPARSYSFLNGDQRWYPLVEVPVRGR